MGQENGRDEEKPVHKVSVRPFLLCQFQVTNAQFSAYRQIKFQRATLPVTSMNWYDATDYCRWLSEQWRMQVRLPTEAEWEFAARGGLEQKLYPWGDEPPESRANYQGRWLTGPEPVATSAPNGYGLYDMCENVHEWCRDWYDPAYYGRSDSKDPEGPTAQPASGRRASRGGAWRHHIKIVRCAARSSLPPEFKYADYGFRIAADLPEAR
jgi:sulfatase modifying factor 1